MKNDSKRRSSGMDFGDLRLSWLETFVSVSQLETRSDSAKALNITQGAVTKRIQSLERWSRMVLVHHYSAPPALTDQGKDFLKVAVQILEVMAAARMPSVTPVEKGAGISVKDLRVPPSVPKPSEA